MGCSTTIQSAGRIPDVRRTSRSPHAQPAVEGGRPAGVPRGRSCRTAPQGCAGPAAALRYALRGPSLYLRLSLRECLHPCHQTCQRPPFERRGGPWRPNHAARSAALLAPPPPTHMCTHTRHHIDTTMPPGPLIYGPFVRPFIGPSAPDATTGFSPLVPLQNAISSYICFRDLGYSLASASFSLSSSACTTRGAPTCGT